MKEEKQHKPSLFIHFFVAYTLIVLNNYFHEGIDIYHAFSGVPVLFLVALLCSPLPIIIWGVNLFLTVVFFSVHLYRKTYLLFLITHFSLALTLYAPLIMMKAFPPLYCL